MTEAGELLRQAARRIGKTPEAVQQIVQRVVEENWIETAEGLRQLTDEQWSSLRVPLALQAAVKELLQAPAAEAAANTSGPAVAAATAAPAVSHEPLAEDGAAVKPIFTSALERVRTAAAPDCGPVHALLATVIGNVIAAPEDRAKRSVKKAAMQRRCGEAYPPAADVLQGCGFTDDGEYLRLSVASLPLLRLARSAVDESLRISRFDPYAATVTATTANGTNRILADPALRTACGVPPESAAAQYKREKEQREALLRAPPVSLPEVVPVIISHSALAPPLTEGRIEPGNSASEEQKTNNDCFTVEELARLKQSLTDGPSFRLRAGQDLAHLNTLPAPPETARLRVVFPDSWVADLTLPATAAVAEICRALNPVLAESIRSQPFQLYVAPPVEVLRTSLTLRRAGLAPAAKIFFRLAHGVVPPPTAAGLPSAYIDASLIKPDMLPPPPPPPPPRRPVLVGKHVGGRKQHSAGGGSPAGKSPTGSQTRSN